MLTELSKVMDFCIGLLNFNGSVENNGSDHSLKWELMSERLNRGNILCTKSKTLDTAWWEWSWQTNIFLPNTKQA